MGTGGIQPVFRVSLMDATDPLGKLHPGFCAFYALWPRKVGRKQAFSAYLRRVKPEQAESFLQATQTALNGRYAGRETRYIPHPTTWINSLDWMEEAEADLSSGTRKPNRTDGFLVANTENRWQETGNQMEVDF